MGHSRLGAGLPRTRQWQEVIGLISGGASAAAVAAATLEAAEEHLAVASRDPALRHTFWLLTQLPDAARSDDFASRLSDLGIRVSGTPSSAELVSALGNAVEQYAGTKAIRSGPGELARLAAVESLSGLLRERTPSLFAATPGDVQKAMAGLATDAQFAQLSRRFFARFAERYLKYFVDREVPLHVGAGRRFDTLADREAFGAALEKHCFQAAKIVESFAGAWYSKARFEKTLTEDRTEKFLGYAFKKLRDELRRGAA